jgi:WD40 repeat protein
MEDLKPKATRPPFCLEFTKLRKDYGAPVKFNFHDAEIDDMHEEVAQAKQKKLTAKEAQDLPPEKIVSREEMTFSFQVAPLKQTIATQTYFAETTNCGVLYGPIEKSQEDATVELESKPMSDFLASVWPRYEVALLMNASTDIYEDDLAGLVDGDDQMQGSSKGDLIKEAYSFQDLVYSKNKQIICIDWHEQGKGTLGCAYVQKQDFSARMDKLGHESPAVVLVWDFADNINPQYILEGPCDMFCFRFNPSDPDWVVGGCISGQVCVWNLKTGHRAPTTFAEQLAMNKPEGNKSVEVEQAEFSPSLFETSHRRPVTDLCWLPVDMEFSSDGFITKTSDGRTNQFATISGDGAVLIWDIRVKKDTRRPDKEPIWNPTFKFSLKSASGELHGGCQLSVVSTPEGAKFICTTESGALISATWNKLKGSAEAMDDDEAADGPFVQSASPGHFGACQSLQRSPFFADTWLTVGDWRFSLWKEGVDEPIFSSPFQPCRVTCARWSPNRPSVVFVGREDGVMDVWDLLELSHASLSQYMFTQPIVSLEFPKGKGDVGHGHYLGVGDDTGMCHVMRLPRMLTKPSRTEEKAIKALFEREESRVEYIKRRTEFRAEERTRLESQAGAEDDSGPDPVQVAKEMEEPEKQFEKLREQFEKDMGLNQPEEEEDI